jgi:hypothetical protein
MLTLPKLNLKRKSEIIASGFKDCQLSGEKAGAAGQLSQVVKSRGLASNESL